MLVRSSESGSVKRHHLNVQPRSTHVDCDAPIIFQSWRDDARHGLNADIAAVRQPFVHHKFDEGARAIAALFDLAAIRIEYAVAKINSAAARLLHDQDLVSPNAEATVCDGAPLSSGKVHRLVNSIDHHKIIAGTVHFRKFEFHSEKRSLAAP